MTKAEVKYKKPSEITPYANNPRDNDESVKSVAKSIKLFGFQNPIIIDKKNVIIAGHTRWKAALTLKLSSVPVIVSSLSEDDAKAYRIIDNRLGELAVWDYDKLGVEMETIDPEYIELMDFENQGVDIVGYTKPEDLEIKPFKNVHFLISTTVENSIEIMDIIKTLSEIEGVDIESGAN